VPISSHVIALIAAGSSGSGGKGGSGLLSFLPLILIVGVGYLLLIRPARNRQRKAAQQRAEIEPGVEVTTTAGLIATVVSIEDDIVTLEIAPGVQSRYIKGAIARVHNPFEPEPETDPSADPDAATDAEAGGGIDLRKSGDESPEQIHPEQTEH
jgi:preprotein translocase subunit YajC